METKISINTRDGQESFTTKKIVGKLDAILIDVNESDGIEKVELIIESELGYLILQRKEISGINYLLPRARTTTPIEDLKDSSGYGEFNLNEKLIITVIGKKNTDIKIILRMR